jgi:hypothetical protein
MSYRSFERKMFFKQIYSAVSHGPDEEAWQLESTGRSLQISVYPPNRATCSIGLAAILIPIFGVFCYVIGRRQAMTVEECGRKLSTWCKSSHGTCHNFDKTWQYVQDNGVFHGFWVRYIRAISILLN